MDEPAYVKSFRNDIVLVQMGNGLLVTQGNKGYVARNWEMSTSTEELIETAITAGFGCMIRQGHPRSDNLWPNENGVVYLAFSRDETFQWSLAIDTFNANTRDYGHGVFNGKYHEQFKNAGIPFVLERRNPKAAHLEVDRELVLPTIETIRDFDHTVLAYRAIGTKPR